MFDINFFKKSKGIKKKIIASQGLLEASKVYATFERLRNKRPYVFNIETTNACNMRCLMCPRPALMKRPIQHMDMDLFAKIVRQITPHSNADLKEFWNFIQQEYGIRLEDTNENSFYFYRVARYLILHGYGEPLLDPHIIERVALCTAHHIPTYFSCVPANIDIAKVTQIMKARLNVIKFSLPSLDDESQKKIQGQRSNFTESYRNICGVLEAKSKDPSITTEIVVTMVQLSDDKDFMRTANRFMDLWKDKPVYAYIKSQDNRWFYEKDPKLVCRSHYESQYCEYPWTSMTIMVDGSVVPCTQDYNAEMAFGNANSKPLEDIWNSQAYDEFRKRHIYGNFPKRYKCVSRCDQKLVFKRMEAKSHG